MCRCNRDRIKCPASIAIAFVMRHDTWNKRAPLLIHRDSPVCAMVCSLCFALISMMFVPKPVLTNFQNRAVVVCIQFSHSPSLTLSNCHLETIDVLILNVLYSDSRYQSLWENDPKFLTQKNFHRSMTP